MVVAAVLKYADNILKCFGNATSIALSCLLSYHLIGDFTPSLFYVVGTSLVIVAMYLYSGKDDVPMAGAEGGRRRVRLPASLRRFLRRLLLGKKPGGSAARSGHRSHTDHLSIHPSVHRVCHVVLSPGLRVICP